MLELILAPSPLLAAVARAAAVRLMAFDVDGTLVDFAAHPDAIRIDGRLQHALLDMHQAFRKNDRARLAQLLPQVRGHAL